MKERKIRQIVREEVLAEIGEGGRVYDLKFDGFGSGTPGAEWGYRCSFEGPDQRYEVYGNHFDNGRLSVEFAPEDSHANALTGAGKPLSVINTVVEALANLVHSRSPDPVKKVSFYAGERRNNIYKKFVTNKFPEASVRVDDGVFEVYLD